MKYWGPLLAILSSISMICSVFLTAVTIRALLWVAELQHQLSAFGLGG